MSDRSDSPPERKEQQVRSGGEEGQQGRRSEERDSNETRRRSRSPQRDVTARRERSLHRERESNKSRRKDAGFKWKEKRRDDRDRQDRDEGLRRGYRDHYRPRSRSRTRSRSPRRFPERKESDGNGRKDLDKNARREDKKKEKKPAVAVPQQEMIIVHVNDRLGTKKAVPCLPTDLIKDFKVIVASMIGRRPYEILLKRQGERPFKDILTLQDYGVSNNSQLDLEVDTGD